ncbi:MAG: glycine zipper domain-containing protein [Rhodoferax sp.]
MLHRYTRAFHHLGWAAALAAASALAAPAHADPFDAVLGGGLGAAAGVLIGQSLGGREGAIIGGALGAATGVAVANEHRRGGAQQRISAPPPPVYAPPPRVVTYYPENVAPPPPAFEHRQYGGDAYWRHDGYAHHPHLQRGYERHHEHERR